jgi:hypothetical protein
MVMFNWTKRPSNTFRKRRMEDAARRLSDTSSDYLPDGPSLDGDTVREIPRTNPLIYSNRTGNSLVRPEFA